jgi:hypothetical protein
VADWAADFMRRRRRDLKLGPNEARWPPVKELPTIWGYHAYLVSRLFMQMRDGRRVDENDLEDWGHYSAAMYADELVIEDRKFREIAGLCPSPGPTLRSFREWGQSILGFR